jgi:hypothetical protein
MLWSFSCNYDKNAKRNTFPAYRLPRLLLVMKSNNKIRFYLHAQNTAEPCSSTVSEIVPQYPSYQYQTLLQIPVETSRYGLLNLFKPSVQRILTSTIHRTPRRVYWTCYIHGTDREKDKRMNLHLNGGSINNTVFLMLSLINYKSWPIYRQMTQRLWMVKYEISYFTKWTGENYLYLKLQTHGVIHNFLRDFRPLRYSSRDGHAEAEHVNKGIGTPSFCPNLQVLNMSTPGDAEVVNPVIKCLPHTWQYLAVDSSDCLQDPSSQLW